eukprot:scaffold6731_cov135-Isochrysis_galbana.AAC.1
MSSPTGGRGKRPEATRSAARRTGTAIARRAEGYIGIRPSSLEPPNAAATSDLGSAPYTVTRAGVAWYGRARANRAYRAIASQHIVRLAFGHTNTYRK